MPKPPPPFPCPDCRTGFDLRWLSAAEKEASFELCQAHADDYEAWWQDYGFSPVGYLEARTYSVPFEKIEKPLRDLVDQGIEKEDRQRFYASFADRIYRRGKVTAEGRFSVEFTIEELAGHVQRHNGRLSRFEVDERSVKRLTRTEDSPLAWDVLLVHEFYGATPETAELLEARFAHLRSMNNPRDPRVLRVLPANKTEAEKLSFRFGRYAVPGNTREWARWLKVDDLNEVAEILGRDYPGLFRPSSLTAYTRVGLSRHDAPTWHAELSRHTNYTGRSPERAPLANRAAEYAAIGLTADGLVQGEWALMRPSAAAKWYGLGFTSPDEVEKWRSIIEEIGEESASEHVRNGTPIEWVQSFLRGAVNEEVSA